MSLVEKPKQKSKILLSESISGMRRKSYMIVFYDLEQLKKLLMVLDSKKDLKVYQGYKFAYILHDRDISQGKEIKKLHYHLALEFVNTIDSLRLFEVIKEYLPNKQHSDINKADAEKFSYLFHWNTPRKVQYEFDELLGTNMELDDLYDIAMKYRRVLKEESNAGHVMLLIDFLEENKCVSFLHLVNTLIAKNEVVLLGWVTKNVYLVRSLMEK